MKHLPAARSSLFSRSLSFGPAVCGRRPAGQPVEAAARPCMPAECAPSRYPPPPLCEAGLGRSPRGAGRPAGRPSLLLFVRLRAPPLESSGRRSCTPPPPVPEPCRPTRWPTRSAISISSAASLTSIHVECVGESSFFHNSFCRLRFSPFHSLSTFLRSDMKPTVRKRLSSSCTYSHTVRSR